MALGAPQLSFGCERNPLACVSLIGNAVGFVAIKCPVDSYQNAKTA
jgi:hypothetical protein